VDWVNEGEPLAAGEEALQRNKIQTANSREPMKEALLLSL